MTLIETISDLRQSWSRIADALGRDLSATAGLRDDPEATLRRHGFVLSADMMSTLESLLP